MPRFCGKCGTELNENAKFCQKCGATVRDVTEKQEKVENSAHQSISEKPAYHESVRKEPVLLHPDSYFAGDTITYLGYILLICVVCVFTLCIAFPWVYNKYILWKKQHTYIEGKRLDFDGTGTQLFVKYIKWLLLSIITLGIYSWFIPLKLERWVDQRTFFAKE